MYEVTIGIETKILCDDVQWVEFKCENLSECVERIGQFQAAFALSDQYVAHIEIVPQSQKITPDEPPF